MLADTLKRQHELELAIEPNQPDGKAQETLKPVVITGYAATEADLKEQVLVTRVNQI